MFVLAEMSDTIRVPPHMFTRKLDDAVKTVLNKQLANKVCGLYASVYSDFWLSGV